MIVQKVQPLGTSSSQALLHEEKCLAHWFILNNVDKIEEYPKYAFLALYFTGYFNFLLSYCRHKDSQLCTLENTWGWYVVKLKALLTFLNDINKHFLICSEPRYIEYMNLRFCICLFKISYSFTSISSYRNVWERKPFS